MLDQKTSGVGIVSDYEPIPIKEFSEENNSGKDKGDSLFLYFASFTGNNYFYSFKKWLKFSLLHY